MRVAVDPQGRAFAFDNVSVKGSSAPARADWSDAWEYAQANNVENIGTDGTVITDGMILSAVSATAAM